MLSLLIQLALLFSAGLIAGFINILAAVMIAVLILTIVDPTKYLQAPPQSLTGFRRVLFLLGFFGVGVFGGFIQAGVGFIIISVMLLTGFNLIATNAVKSYAMRSALHPRPLAFPAKIPHINLAPF